MKTKKIFPVLLIAIAFFTASCVDNKISSEVEAIRGQQVEWMKAKTATETALVAMKTADADYRKAQTDAVTKQTAFDEATRSWNLKDRELSYNLAKAQNDVDLAAAKNALATKQAELNAALATYAASVANSKSNEATTDFLKYKDQVDQLAGLYSQRSTLQTNLANAKLAATAGVDAAASTAKSLQSSIDALKVILATQNATLATLNSALGASTFVSANQTISLKKDSLNAIYYTNSTNISTANANVRNLQYTIASYNNLLSQLNDPAITPSLKASVQSQLDAQKTAYDDAITKYPQYVQYALKLNADNAALLSQIGALQNAMNLNSSVINYLNNASYYYDNNTGSSYTGVKAAIAYMNSQIVSTQSQINQQTASLNSNNSTESSDDLIASLTKQLDTLNSQITTVENQAASWKSLLDKLFTA